MKKIALTFALIAGCFASFNSLHAQIFTSNLTDWNTLGNPLVSDSSDATIFSTDTGSSGPNDSSSAAVTATTLQADLLNGNTLYNSHAQAASNGQALYLTFYVSAPATISFDWQMQSYDGYPYDGVGYILNGTYTDLADPPDYDPSNVPSLSSTFPTTVNLPAGTDTFAFVAFNTGTPVDSTNLIVSDLTSTVTTPEPSTGTLILMTGLVLVLVRKWRASGFFPLPRRHGATASLPSALFKRPQERSISIIETGPREISTVIGANLLIKA